MLGFTTTINLKTREIKTTFAFGKGERGPFRLRLKDYTEREAL